MWWWCGGGVVSLLGGGIGGGGVCQKEGHTHKNTRGTNKEKSVEKHALLVRSGALGCVMCCANVASVV